MRSGLREDTFLKFAGNLWKGGNTGGNLVFPESVLEKAGSQTMASPCMLLGKLTEGTWTDNGDGTGMIMSEGRDYPIALDGGLLIGYADDNTTIYERSEVTAKDHTIDFYSIILPFINISGSIGCSFFNLI